MSNQLILPVVAGQLPTGFCPPDLQSMLNGFSAVQTVTFPSTFTGIVKSATKPTDTTQVWQQLDAMGNPTQIYVFANGAWISRHPLPSGFIMLWLTVLPSFNTFDGGDGNALSSISGPMWEVVTDFAARSPMGVGTLPSGAVIAVDATAGEEVHVLTAAEGSADPNHTHTIGRFGSAASGDTFLLTGASTKDGSANRNTGGGAVTDTLANQTGSYAVSSTPNSTATPVGHNTIHPVLGCYFLRRTARQFYLVP